MAWRNAENGLSEAEEEYNVALAIHGYLHDGITWNRLRAIAVQSVAQGGLNLFAENSQEDVSVFGVAVPHAVLGRPESMCTFLCWLGSRVHVLPQIVQHDVASRNLGNEVQKAATGLNDSLMLGKLVVLAVLLSKSMYLFRCAKGKRYISMSTNLPDLSADSIRIILDLRIERHVLETLQISWAPQFKQL